MPESSTTLIIYAIALEILVAVPILLFKASAKYRNVGVVLSLIAFALLALNAVQLLLTPWFRVVRGNSALLIDPFTLYFLLLFIVSIAGHRRFKKLDQQTATLAAAKRTASERKLPVGLVLVILYFAFIAPLVAIYSVYQPYWVVVFEWIGPNVGSKKKIPYLFFSCLLISTSLYVAYKLWARKPKAPTIVKRYLVVALVLGTASPYLWLLDDYAMSLVPPPGPYLSVRQVLTYLSIESLLLNLGIGIAIWSYLKLSKRARTTYTS